MDFYAVFIVKQWNKFIFINIILNFIDNYRSPISRAFILKDYVRAYIKRSIKSYGTKHPNTFDNLFKGMENRKYKRNRKRNCATQTKLEQKQRDRTSSATNRWTVELKRGAPLRGEWGEGVAVAWSAEGAGGPCGKCMARHGMKIWCAMALGSKCDWPAAERNCSWKWKRMSSF